MFGRLFKTPWFLGLGLVPVLFLVLMILRVQPQKIVVEKRIRNLQEKIAELENTNQNLAQLLEYFDSPDYLEQEAKLKLNVKRPGEQVVFVYPQLSAEANSTVVVEKKSLWRIIKSWLTKN